MFNIVFNKETNKKEKMPGNILKRLHSNKSTQFPFIVVYNFEAMTIETDDQSKAQE